MDRTRWGPRGARPRTAALAVGIAAIALLAGGGSLSGWAPPPGRSGTGGSTPHVQPDSTVAPSLSVAGTSPTTAGLTWTATSDLTFSKYEVQKSTSSSSGPWTTVGTLSSQSATTYYASGLTPSSTYWWQVVEVDSLSVAVDSNAVQDAQPGTATLAATVSSSTSVHLAWVNHASYGGSVKFESYSIWQSSGGGAATSVGSITSETTTTADPGGLTTGTTYTFQVETTDGCGTASNCGSTTASASTYSNSPTATPAAVAPVDYTASFSESGLPSGTSWSVTLNASSLNSTGSSISFSVPNGSYAFTAGGAKGYTASPSSGSLTVAGRSVSQAESFHSLAKGTYSVTFSESGLTTGTSWSITLGSSTQASSGATNVFTEVNGSYSFSVTAPSGYTASPASGTVTVAGGAVTTPVNFTYASGSTSTSISHVVLIVLENEETTNLWAGAPYERYLASAYGNATKFYATCHDSSADYLAVTSGRTLGCGNVYPNPGYNVTEIGDLFEGHNLTWTAFEESMPSACDLSSSGYYINYHDPFVYYESLTQNATRCDAHVISASSFNQSIKDGSLPAFSFYTPNWADDGHGPTNSPWTPSTGLTHIESWLKGFLPPILNHTGAFDTSAERALVNHTAFMLLYDEGTTNQGYTAGSVYTSGCYNQTGQHVTACGGHVQLTVISPYSVHRQYTQDATTYSVQSTIEWLFGLPGDGGLDGTSSFPAMTSLFSFTSNDYSPVHAGLVPPTTGVPGSGGSSRSGASSYSIASLSVTWLIGGGMGASAAAVWAIPRLSGHVQRVRRRNTGPPAR